MKKGILGAAIATLILSSPVLADDGFNWTGPHVGVQGAFDVTNLTLWDSGNPTASGGSGALGLGVDLGYNLQHGKYVFGLEADGNLLTGNATNLSAKDTYNAQTDWYGPVRAKAGVTQGNGQVYLTGGFAGADLRLYDATIKTYIQPGLNFGWVAGAGFEEALSPKVTIKAEALHIEYFEQGAIIFSNPVNWQNRDNLIRLGVNFHF